jgi:hypothetical protein
MAAPQPVDGLDPRRAYSRLEVGIPAYFDTLDGRLKVRLVDLSQGGAHLVLPSAEPVTEGVLSWLRFDTFAIAVWQREEHLGLEFDRLLPISCLMETRHRAPSVVREAAEAWVQGTLSDD